VRSRAIGANWRPALRPTTVDALPSERARPFRGRFRCLHRPSEAPVIHRRFIRLDHLLERLFVEERRRPKIISTSFDQKQVLKLMSGAFIRAAERRRGLRFI
jgi:hypothetical protein